MMTTKASLIVRNSLLAAAAVAGAGLAIYATLRHFDPAAQLPTAEADALVTNLRAVASTVAQIAATIAGFVFAALALLLSLLDRTLLKRMGESGHLHVLILRMTMSMLFSFALCVLGVAFMVVPHIGTTHLYVIAAACAAVAMSVLDVISKLMMVFLFLSPLPAEEIPAARTIPETN